MKRPSFQVRAATAAGQRHRLSHALAPIDRNGQPSAPTRTGGLPRVTARPFAAGVCSAGRIVGSARGSPGEGITGGAGPHNRVPTFAHAAGRPHGFSPRRRSGSEPIRGAGSRRSRVRMGCPCALRSPDNEMWMMRGDIAHDNCGEANPGTDVTTLFQPVAESGSMSARRIVVEFSKGKTNREGTEFSQTFKFLKVRKTPRYAELFQHIWHSLGEEFVKGRSP